MYLLIILQTVAMPYLIVGFPFSFYSFFSGKESGVNIYNILCGRSIYIFLYIICIRVSINFREVFTMWWKIKKISYEKLPRYIKYSTI